MVGADGYLVQGWRIDRAVVGGFGARIVAYIVTKYYIEMEPD